MKSNFKIHAGLMACVCLFAVNAGAIPTVDSSYLIGTTGGNPASPPDELTRLQGLLGAYNGGTLPPGDTLAAGINVPAAPLPNATVNNGQNSESATSFNVNLGTSLYEYLLVKWADVDAFYYIGGLSGSVTVNNGGVVDNNNGVPQSASHYDLFGPFTTLTITTNSTSNTPDGGSTVFLLGAALSGLGLVARRIKS